MSLLLLSLCGFVALAAYVHRTCMARLGPNKTDNAVLSYPAQHAHPGAEPVSPPVLFVILGWGGSTTKQLRRIVTHCTHTLLCPVITYINPMTGFLQAAPDQEFVLQILEQVKEQVKGTDGAAASATSPTGFVIFVHSNNGAFVYGELKRHFMNPASPYYPLRSLLRGVVFDSAPALFAPLPSSASLLTRVWGGLNAAWGYSLPACAIVLGRVQYVHLFWTPALMVWLGAYRLGTILSTKLAGGSALSQGTRAHIKQGLESDVPRVPHLFLYSRNDKLLLASFVEAYIAFLRKLPEEARPDVHAHDFVTTGHVQHFLKAKEQYTQQLDTFVRDVQAAATTRHTLAAAQKEA